MRLSSPLPTKTADLLLTLPPPDSCRQAFAREGFVLVAQCCLPQSLADLSAAAERVARQSSISIDRRPEGSPLVYRVVSGERVAADAPLLFDLYRSPQLLAWIASVTGQPSVSLSPHLRSAVNVNCLSVTGEEYPEHRDAVPYTGLLFLNDLDDAAGGQFVIRSARGRRVEIQPRLGIFVLMDGTRCPHSVAPLRRDVLRLTMPMVFPAIAAERPTGLDEYLYGGQPRSF